MSKQGQKRNRTKDCCPDIGALFAPRFFKALCEPNRIALLIQLSRCGRPCTVTELTECCPVNVSVVSRHLALLRDAGILSAEKRGKEVYYSVRSSRVVANLRAMADALENCCDDASSQPV